MADNDTGRAAFPGKQHSCPICGISVITEPGMTLLDYFAAKAMQGMIADPGHDPDDYWNATAKLAYGMGAAMLAEKARRESKND